MGRRTALIATIALAATACDDRTARRAAFDDHVIPVLESRCTSPVCHGLAPGAEASGDVVDRSLFFVDTDYTGGILDQDQAYEVARRAIVAEAPAWSTLLRKPLEPVYGGLPHFGATDFHTPEDPGYRAIHDWIALEEDGGQDEPPLDDLEALFAETVLPVLGGTISGDRFAYRYLNLTVETFPHGQAFCRLLEEAGFQHVTATPLTLGVASLYEAVRGPDREPRGT